MAAIDEIWEQKTASDGVALVMELSIYKLTACLARLAETVSSFLSQSRSPFSC
ncbi:hypothetical protein GB928_025585 [Shinella curvata]|uniref:Uncharacterized protein n=1 Tax=Shinella curvata TaxID=1817964 RepID=A0ABT8XN36_9HYPH|nr:hypothetical protein [Shinella curvata]MCJ8056595.1 hypothetical protein [Shinella curvata]MDO6124565.1 hypothetical protein [Shinella curvata]